MTPRAAPGGVGQHQDYRWSTSLSFRRSALLSWQAGVSGSGWGEGVTTSAGKKRLLFCSTQAFKETVAFREEVASFIYMEEMEKVENFKTGC